MRAQIVSSTNLAHYVLYRVRDIWPDAVTIRPDNSQEQYSPFSRLQPSSGVIYRSELEHHMGMTMGLVPPTIQFEQLQDRLVLTHQGADEVYEYLVGLPVWQNLIGVEHVRA